MFVPETEATTTGVNPSKLNLLITFSEEFGVVATFTITTYSCVVPSSAVTVYITDFVKSLAVEPLI